MSAGIYFAVAAAVLFLDLLTKHLVRSYMPRGSEIRLLPFFSLVHIENTGVAFGFFQDRNAVLLVLGSIIVAFLIYYGYRHRKDSGGFSLILAVVVGGALGNLFDRVRSGRVTDFLDFYVGRYHWPAFNVADSAITVGACFLIFWGWRNACTRS